MTDVQDNLNNLKQAWEAFQKTAHEASAEERQLFERLIRDMDAAEIKLKRDKTLDLYE